MIEKQSQAAANQIIRWDLIDTHTGNLLRSYDNSRAAHRRADKLDLQYGAVRYAVRLIFSK